MDNFNLRKFLTEGKINEEEKDIDISKNEYDEEITIKGFGGEYTGTFNSEDPDDIILFIHFFEDDEYHGEEEMPELFKYFTKYGGETFLDDDEATLSISLNNLMRQGKMADPVD